VSPVGLIPYRACQFDHVTIKNSTVHHNNCGVEEIIVGPALGRQQTTAVDALLATHHMRVTIRPSSIPYVAD